MDVGMTKFETTSKVVTLMDAPGHKDFIPNMITGAAQVNYVKVVNQRALFHGKCDGTCLARFGLWHKRLFIKTLGVLFFQIN